MSWFNFFQTTSSCDISFGRGINASIHPEEEELFNTAYKAFENKEILNGFEAFFNSLINFNDKISNENITLELKEDALHFCIYQGSAKIKGVITQESLKAEVLIVKTADATVALKRYILERNYQLTYANYCMDEEYIKIKLYLDNISLSPQKIFFPLRELALNADFDKEHIKSEFKDITLEEISHIQALPQDELKQKYEYMQEQIQTLQEKVLTLPSNDNAGMQAFLYLNFLLKLDYLLVPKFAIYQKLSKKIQEYFGDENNTIEAKNDELQKYVLTLKELNYEAFSENFYNAKYTFSQIDKSQYNEIVNFITESQSKIRWYKNNRYNLIIPTIYSYIAFHSLYNYGMNQVLRELFHILVEVLNADCFSRLKCDALYDEESQTFAKRTIIAKLNAVVDANTQKYTSLAIFSDELNFNSLNEFAYSYYGMLKNLDFEEI